MAETTKHRVTVEVTPKDAKDIRRKALLTSVGLGLVTAGVNYICSEKMVRMTFARTHGAIVEE